LKNVNGFLESLDSTLRIRPLHHLHTTDPTTFQAVFASRSDYPNIRSVGSNLKFQDLAEPFQTLLERSIGLQSRRSAPHGITHRRVPQTANGVADLAQSHACVPLRNQHR
jgi:hypothetical protein